MKIYQYFSIDLPIRLYNFARHLINLHSTSQKIQDRQILLAFSLCDSGKALALQINKHKKEKLFSSALRHGFCLAKIKRHKNWTRTISHRRSCAHRTSTLDHSICRQINQRKRRKTFLRSFFPREQKSFRLLFRAGNRSFTSHVLSRHSLHHLECVKRERTVERVTQSIMFSSTASHRVAVSSSSILTHASHM